MDEDIHIGKLIMTFSNMINRKIGKKASKYGMTSVQSRILGFIRRESYTKDIFQKDIEEELNIRRSSVTSVLQLMEKKKLIKRVRVCEDGRLKKIVLTKEGLEAEKKVYDSILKIERSLRDELSDSEFYTLINLINRLSKKIQD
ncbi:MarR family transcriptional regulator [Clostridium sp. cel8]|jgi:DNA-binding MarR family transcriptional regulator|uniref:MarR family winged helix-turn-helix transcriptional regulator n=1 Tax=unclassified Clostridium TaxID=2614128 RepID=UPI0015F49379|nr:MarR family transcriptional regulator [Clostridium sp. cel8]MBA5851172.1 MarR family transcriptional regulator [Clostridium sp. cel8]